MRISARAVVAATVAIAQPALASAYIDMEMGEVKAEEKMTVANPQPTQLLIEFQKDAVTFPKGTKQITPIIAEDIKATGLIGTTSDTPQSNGTRLSVLINMVEDKGLNGKAFMAGFTFGLGSGVVDNVNYTMTISYVPATGAPPISRTLKRKEAFRKQLDVSQSWDSSFIGAVAIPTAEAAYSGLYSTLIEKLLTDPEFIAATEATGCA